MAETLPMLEHDPRHDFRMSRVLRILVFSFVVSTVFVGVLIALMRFLWDAYLRHIPVVQQSLGGGEYNAQPLLVVPMIFIVTGVMAMGLWANAEGKVRPARLRKR
ncbi:MAG: hypothetical protein HYT80_06530 [Euryarchaeota archaeon]|nr:hypothetical protein [Euryarchaeota archaeon]